MAASFVISTYGQERREIRDALLFAVINLIGSGFFLAAVVGLAFLLQLASRVLSLPLPGDLVASVAIDGLGRTSRVDGLAALMAVQQFDVVLAHGR